jgi:hypothetical protein
MMIVRISSLALSLVLSLSAFALPGDSDGDGLGDNFEEELLAKFAPKFMVSSNECDGLPAEFLPGALQPQLLAKNGTIYGQVSKAAFPGKPGHFLEVRYYHLWNQDCGRLGHPLDIEHVSALIGSETASESAAAWKAEYWYAAAHEDTVCDSSHAVRSSFINAEHQGPVVWISSGKHASFLSQKLCRGGCGGDNCKTMHPLIISRLINLGERNAPMNGISWIEWPGWPLAAKMHTDFPESVLQKLNAAKKAVIIPINESPAPVKTTILVSGTTASALALADRKTNKALAVAGSAVGTSLDKSGTKTGNALKRAALAFWRAMRCIVPKSKKENTVSAGAAGDKAIF